MISRVIGSRNFKSRFHNLGLRSLLQPFKTNSMHSLETSEVYNYAIQLKTQTIRILIINTAKK